MICCKYKPFLPLFLKTCMFLPKGKNIHVGSYLKAQKML